MTIANLEMLALLAAAAVCDAKRGVIPNKLVVAGFALAALNIAARPSAELAVSGLLGALVGGLPIFVIIAATNGGMGAGDMKLAAMAGAFAGPAGALVILCAAFVACGLYAAVMLALGRKTLRSRVVFAPFIALGGVVQVFFGRQFLLWTGSIG